MIASDAPFNILWLRRDLRLTDNRALIAAKQAGLPILPLFIFDQDILDKLDDRSDLRLNFIHQTLINLNKQLLECGSGVYTVYGKPDQIWSQLCQDWPVNKIFSAQDFEPYAQSRDTQVEAIANENGVHFEQVLDHIIFHPDAILSGQQKPYQVYTPYSKQWIKSLNQPAIAIDETPLKNIQFLKHKSAIVSLEEMNFKSFEWAFPKPEVQQKTIDQYGELRNLPALDATSKLGLHLRFGTVSVRKILADALSSSDETFLKQLIWREFFIQIMHHYPNSMNEEFRAKYRNMPWKFNEQHFNAWKEGRTGIPLVDAGMRELNATGFMHNRVRMVAASWLTKNLLIDWRLGERYFAQKLLDFELASNVGSWQWVAGTGVDAAPYFRIFNPFTQAKKFDPDRKYIEKWVPEIDSLDYPAPMIDYKASREACLTFYKTHMSPA